MTPSELNPLMTGAKAPVAFRSVGSSVSVPAPVKSIVLVAEEAAASVTCSDEPAPIRTCPPPLNAPCRLRLWLATTAIVPSSTMLGAENDPSSVVVTPESTVIAPTAVPPEEPISIEDALSALRPTDPYEEPAVSPANCTTPPLYEPI